MPKKMHTCFQMRTAPDFDRVMVIKHLASQQFVMAVSDACTTHMLFCSAQQNCFASPAVLKK